MASKSSLYGKIYIDEEDDSLVCSFQNKFLFQYTKFIKPKSSSQNPKSNNQDILLDKNILLDKP